MNGPSVAAVPTGIKTMPLSSAAALSTTGPSWVNVLCLQNRGKIPPPAFGLRGGLAQPLGDFELRLRRHMISALLFAVPLVSTNPQKVLDCASSAHVKAAIGTLGQLGASTLDKWAVLAREPAAAACELVRSLHVVHETHVVGYEQGEHPETMRVIWAIRLLRYLTGCQDFRGMTTEDPAKWDELRRDFLLRDNSGAPAKSWEPAEGIRFFQTWMSRDSVFIAPVDAQAGIIAHWRRWYQDSGSRGFQFHTCESVDNWYF